jgi:hypothetical protein
MAFTFRIATAGTFPSRNRMLEEGHRELQQPNDVFLAEMIMFAENTKRTMHAV